MTTLCIAALFGIALGLGPAPGAAQARGGASAFDDAEIAHVEHPDWFKNSFLDLREDLAESLAAGKKGLMVFFGTEGCSYCKAFLERSLGDPEIQAIVRANFDVIGLEIFDDAEMTDPRGEALRVKAFAEREGAQFAPTLLFFGAGGETLLRIVGYYPPERFRAALEYVIGGHYRAGSLREFVARGAKTEVGAAPRQALTADPLFITPPYLLDRRIAAERPLLVLFEETDCMPCADFHAEVLADADVRSLLGRFEVVRLDARDARTPVLAPDGSRITPARWFEELGLADVPALVFFDEAGREVLRVDAMIRHQRTKRSLLYVLERAYAEGMSYQRFTRLKSMQERGARSGRSGNR